MKTAAKQEVATPVESGVAGFAFTSDVLKVAEQVEVVRKGLIDVIQAEIKYSESMEEVSDGILMDLESSFRHHETTKNELIDVQRRLNAIEILLTKYHFV